MRIKTQKIERSELQIYSDELKNAKMQLGKFGKRKIVYNEGGPTDSLNQKITEFSHLIKKIEPQDFDLAWEILLKLARLSGESGVDPQKKVSSFTRALYFFRSIPTLFYRREAKFNTIDQHLRLAHSKKIVFESEPFKKCERYFEEHYPTLKPASCFHGPISEIQSVLLKLLIVKKARPSVGLFIDEKSSLVLFEKNDKGGINTYQFGKVELPPILLVSKHNQKRPVKKTP